MDPVISKRTIEALLFAAGSPLTVPQIVETIEVINADITRDSRVDIQDLLALIDRWGSSDADGDLNGDGSVAIGDLLIVLSAFGL